MFAYLLVVSLFGTAASSCYLPLNSTQHFEIIHHYSVENQTACQSLCDQNSTCSGISYQPTPLENKCALLGAEIPSQTCLLPTPIYARKAEMYCRTCASPISADLGNDPCIDSQVARVVVFPICARLIGNAPSYFVIRAIMPDGNRITLDNDNASAMACPDKRGYWTYSSHNKTYTQQVVAAACVLSGDSKCPCAPLPLVAGSTQAANVTQIGPCPPNMRLKFDYINYGQEYTATLVDTVLTTIRCMAGEWNCFQTKTGNTWRIKSAGCV